MLPVKAGIGAIPDDPPASEQAGLTKLRLYPNLLTRFPALSSMESSKRDWKKKSTEIWEYRCNNLIRILFIKSLDRRTFY